MNICVDIGNSTVVVGVHHNNIWQHTARVASRTDYSRFYYETSLRQYVLEWDLKPSDIAHIVISSVVPDVTDSFVEAAQRVFDAPIFILTSDVFKVLDMPVPLVYEIGPDIVSNAYGALKKYSDNCIVLDFGTAFTTLYVDISHGIRGVSIASGILTSLQGLVQNTALLPMINLSFPPSVLGRNTVEAIQSGTLYGYIGMAKEMVRKIKEEYNDKAIKTIVTGGLASTITQKFDFDHILDPYLTLDGALEIFKYIYKSQ